MTTHEEQPDTYPWRAAPPHLMTRRQLRAAGLAPGGAQPVAVMVRETTRRGRARRIWAALFDSTQAPPKREATPAQLEAVAKAVRARKLRAAQRRGLTEADLTQTGDPGPAWTTTHQEENTMNTDPTAPQDLLQRAEADAEINAITTEVDQLAASGQIPADMAATVHALVEGKTLFGHPVNTEPEAGVPDFEDPEELAYQLEIDFENAVGGADPAQIDAARAALLDHLRTHRDDIEGANHWDGWYARIDREGQPEPVGHGQRRAQLHALVAVNRARATLWQLEAAAGEDLPPTHFAARTAAEERMAQIPWQNPDSVSMMLADALTWREQSPLAAERADQLIASYAHEWGVIIDPQAMKVTIDGGHDAAARQDFSDAAALWARERAAIGMLAAAPITPAAKAAVEEALQHWSGEQGIDPVNPRGHLDTEQARRAQLTVALDQAQLSDSDRAIVDFTVDYLRGDTTDLDLLATPVVVDPGEEARGRIGALLGRFAAKEMSGALITEELKVMTAADQQTVRAIGLALKAGGRPELDPWPDYIDRDELAEKISSYVIDAEEQAMEADFLVEDEFHERDQIGVSDEIGDRIPRMAAAREELRAIAVDGKGLAPIERAQLTAVLDDIDLGRIQREHQVPELMFADERTKSSLDHLRTIRAATSLRQTFTESITQQIDDTGITGVTATEQQTSTVRSGVTDLAETIHAVAMGATEGVDTARRRFLQQRDDLAGAVATAGADEVQQGAIRAHINTVGGQAGQLGRRAHERSTEWEARTEAITAQRDDRLAQRQATASVRGGRAPRTGKSVRGEQAKTSSPAPAPMRAQAGRRQIHTPEVGR